MATKLPANAGRYDVHGCQPLKSSLLVEAELALLAYIYAVAAQHNMAVRVLAEQQSRAESSNPHHPRQWRGYKTPCGRFEPNVSCCQCSSSGCRPSLPRTEVERHVETSDHSQT